MNIQKFKSRKEVSSFLKEKGIDTSNWSEEKWLSLNKGQAEIHMMALAEAMWDAYNESTPKELKAGEWHIPFGDDIITENFPLTHPVTKDELSLAVKVATARCARVSYTVVGEEGKEPNYENDIKLHDRLLSSGHFSPFEHCSICVSDEEYNNSFKGKEKGWFRNYKGFKSYRQIIEDY